MEKPIIEIKNLSKKYIISHRDPYSTLRDTLAGYFKRNKKEKEEFWALKKVNLKIKKGEILGVIGKNGSGKSTFLKILSQITPPTTGEIKIKGHVNSLLEVGTGFHPELTGRENIFLNGAILGMSQKEIKDKFDEIVAFSEIEQFLDTPVKRYSSGMYVRLAFAVAAHLEPEILLIDEVLAVGDIAFQKKCLGKMNEVSKSGRTIIFVSHNMAAISELCNKCVLLKKGRIAAYGGTAEVVEKYLSEEIKGNVLYEQKSNKNKDMNLRKVLLCQKNKNSNSVYYDEDIVIKIQYEVNKSIEKAIVWFLLQDINGANVFTTADWDSDPRLKEMREKGIYEAEAIIPKKLLNEGSYIVTVGLNTNKTGIKNFDRVEAIEFSVIDNGSTPKSLNNEPSRSGILQPFFQWQTKKIK